MNPTNRFSPKQVTKIHRNNKTVKDWSPAFLATFAQRNPQFLWLVAVKDKKSVLWGTLYLRGRSDSLKIELLVYVVYCDVIMNGFKLWITNEVFQVWQYQCLLWNRLNSLLVLCGLQFLNVLPAISQPEQMECNLRRI